MYLTGGNEMIKHTNNHTELDALNIKCCINKIPPFFVDNVWPPNESQSHRYWFVKNCKETGFVWLLDLCNNLAEFY